LPGVFHSWERGGRWEVEVETIHNIVTHWLGMVLIQVIP